MPELENKLESWVLGLRAQCRGVSTLQIRLKAKDLAQDMEINGFEGGPSWYFQFLQRKHLSSIRAKTNVSQQLSGD